MADSDLHETAPEVISRKEAKARGLKRFFTGRPCQAGHLSERLVSSKNCIVCAYERRRRAEAADPERFRAYSKSYRSKHKEQRAASKRAYAIANREKVYRRQREWVEKNRERVLAQAREWVARNPEKRKEQANAWVKRNLAYANSLWAARQAQKIRAQPEWLTPEQIAEIRRFYKEARDRAGGPWHVDHIVPLRGDNVCGLHVPWNLQIILASENVRKSNKLIE